MAGIFGKLPAAGDFVVRGLAPGMRSALDRFLTIDLGHAVRRPGLWPEAGLCALIGYSGGQMVALLVPSRDRVGREFPLAVVGPGDACDAAGAEAWCAKAAPLAREAAEGLDLSTIEFRLADLAPPRVSKAPLAPPLLWTPGDSPAPPAEALARLFPLSSG